MRDCSSITGQNFSDFLAKCRAEKNSSKEKKTAVASTVSPIDPKEQLQAEMRSLGYVEGLFISLYTIIHANKLPSQACSSISEFFLLCRFDEDIFTRNLEASVEPNMWGGERALKNSIYRLLYLGLCAMEFRQKFCAILNSSETFFFFFS